VFHSNPDCKTQCRDLPNGVEHPNRYNQRLDIPLISIIARICAREYQHLWYSSNELCSSGQQVKLTRCSLIECYCGDYSAGDVNSQEDNNKEDKHASRSLIHGMQPSNHDDLYRVSVKPISLRCCSCVTHRPTWQ